jgi:glyoxylase-like metal-dependent hydrolase (beta-lactamase superfamily II)
VSTTGWFATKQVADGVHLVSEPGHVNCFLVAGSERAVLFDTGMGIADIRPVVEALTDRDLLVVNSHYHYDHRGGNGAFTDIAVHKDGADRYRDPAPEAFRRGYTEFTQEMLARFAVYRELDEQYFHLLTPEITPRPLPGGFSPDRWAVPASVPTRLLAEGDVLDLGDRSLRVLHTPGHSADSICLFDDAVGLLFAGDTLITGTFFVQLPDSDPAAMVRSTRRLADEVGPRLRLAFPAHALRYQVDRAFLEEVADAFEEVAAGATTPRPFRDVFGNDVLQHRFGRFSILTAPW